MRVLGPELRQPTRVGHRALVEPREELEPARLTAEVLADERGTSDQDGEGT